MSDLQALAYVSSAVGALTEADLEALLLRARAFNEAVGVSGALLYHDGSFFQYLEGPAASVEKVYARIKASPKHRGLIELLRRPVEQRQFDGWHMGFARAPRSVILGLAQSDWLDRLHEQEAGAASPPSGVKLLLEFWRNASRRG